MLRDFSNSWLVVLESYYGACGQGDPAATMFGKCGSLICLFQENITYAQRQSAQLCGSCARIGNKSAAVSFSTGDPAADCLWTDRYRRSSSRPHGSTVRFYGTSRRLHY